MPALRSLLSFLPFLHNRAPEERKVDSAPGRAGGVYTAGTATTYTDILPTSGPSNSPLKPATTRCWRQGACVEFAYPAVILEPSARILQAVCPSDNGIIITFADHAAFVTAQGWPMANLVLVGQGYPDCGPLGSADTRFYAITESAVTDANSRSITARIVYVTNDQVIVSEQAASVSPSLWTTTITRVETVSNDALTTTLPITITKVSTVWPTPEPPFTESKPSTMSTDGPLPISPSESTFAPSSSTTGSSTSAIFDIEASLSFDPTPSTRSPSQVSTASSMDSPIQSDGPSCLADGDAFYTDNTGIIYQPQCNWWIRGDVIATFGPRYTAEQCLEACSMVFPGCAYAVFTKSEGGYCSLQGTEASQRQVLFGYDTYERITMHVGTNRTTDSGASENETATPSLPGLSSSASSDKTVGDSSSTMLSLTTSSSTSFRLQQSASAPSLFPSVLLSFAPEPATDSNPGSLPWTYWPEPTTESTSVPSAWFSASESAPQNASPTVHVNVESSTAGSDSCTSTPIQAIVGASCPSGNQSVYLDPSDGRYYEVVCNDIAAATDARFIQAQDIADCAGSCTEACDAFHFGYGECALYTSVIALSSYPGYTVGLVVPSPTQTPCVAPAVEATSTSSSQVRTGTVTSVQSGQQSAGPPSTASLPTAPLASVTPSAGSPCPAFNSSTFVDDNGHTYQVYCGYHLSGPITNVWFFIDSDEQCLEQCDQTDGCAGAVHDSSYPDVCVLYNQQYPSGVGGPPGPALTPIPAFGPQGPGTPIISERHAFVLVQASPAASGGVAAPWPSSTTTGPPNALQTMSCPSSDHTTFTDPTNQRSYVISCGSLLSSPSTGRFTQFHTVRGKYSFAACAALCNSFDCPAFLYSGASSACGLYNAGLDGAASASVVGGPSMTLAKAIAPPSPWMASSRPALPTISSLTEQSTVSAVPSSQPIGIGTSTTTTTSFTTTPSELSTAPTGSEAVPSLSSISSPPVSTPSSLCPVSDGQVITDRTGGRYRVMCNYDRPGADFGLSISPVYGLPTDQECLARCDETPGCVGIVFASTSCNNNWCHCFLKDGVASLVANKMYNSYDRLPDVVNGSSFVVGISNTTTEASQQSGASGTSELMSSTAAPSSVTAQSSTFATSTQSSSASTATETPLFFSSSSSSVSSYPLFPAVPQATLSTSTSTRTSSSSPSATIARASLPLQCPGNNGTAYWAEDGAQFQIMCYMDLRKDQPDIGVSVQRTLEDCIEACDRLGQSGCQGVSWVPQGQGQPYCYYKPAADQFVS